VKPRRWLGYRIELNDLLDDVKRIDRRLAKAGILIDDTFGSSSERPERPERVVIAWGPGVARERVRELLRRLEDIAVDAIAVSTTPPIASGSSSARTSRRDRTSRH